MCEMVFGGRVAPHAGAWIETRCWTSPTSTRRSRPTRARGLKLGRGNQEARIMLSRPTRACGLKRVFGYVLAEERLVAPHAGAWIETSPTRTTSESSCVAPRAGAWIETGLPSCNHRVGRVAPHAGVWICRWRHGWRVISKDGLMGTQWTFSTCNNWGNDCLAVTE